MSKTPPSTIAVNARAKFDYEISDTFEAGIVLTGQEVKSARRGGVKLSGAYVTVHNGEAWLLNAHIARYEKASGIGEYDPTRSRKLLMHKREIQKMIAAKEAGGLTIVPLSLYTVGGKIKVKVALARHRTTYDKREKIKKRDIARELRRGV